MKVRELIAALERENPDADVILSCGLDEQPLDGVASEDGEVFLFDEREEEDEEWEPTRYEIRPDGSVISGGRQIGAFITPSITRPKPTKKLKRKRAR